MDRPAGHDSATVCASTNLRCPLHPKKFQEFWLDLRRDAGQVERGRVPVPSAGKKITEELCLMTKRCAWTFYEGDHEAAGVGAA